ncbi:hypothetical protein DFP94_11581 [Fontibacillus phaseoli]|uniref:Uncharacterized protein n=1 Tax=Fontibacillus phaseoli TaxID=1416533 RepID=A0A369B4C5_9BACL|nr:hypothetical protein DFP94_11581 [Fontibacillus phaseoli]
MKLKSSSGAKLTVEERYRYLTSSGIATKDEPAALTGGFLTFTGLTGYDLTGIFNRG